MDGETAFLALTEIKKQCTGQDGKLDAARYKAAVHELSQAASGNTPAPSTPQAPQGTE